MDSRLNGNHRQSEPRGHREIWLTRSVEPGSNRELSSSDPAEAIPGTHLWSGHRPGIGLTKDRLHEEVMSMNQVLQ